MEYMCVCMCVLASIRSERATTVLITRTHCAWNFTSCVCVQVDQMLRGAPVDSAGNFDYVAFTRILKHGTKDE